jgi:small subunit ribosomal protein S19
MAKKEFTYKGKTLDELKAMSLNEFAEIANARVRRIIARGLRDEDKKLLEKLRKKDNVKTHRREMIILPEMVGKTIQIYNGKSFKAITIAPEMIGHYLGEFALTRNRVSHNAPGVGATRSSAHVSVR